MLLGDAIVTQQTAITPGSGTFLQYQTIQIADQSFGIVTAEDGLYMIDSVQYVIVTGAAVSGGSIGVQLLMPWGGVGGTWVPMTTPNSATGAAFTLIATLAASTTYNGILTPSFTPCVGIRLSYTSLAGGNITNAALFITKR